MKKSIVTLLLILSTLALTYAVYESQKVEKCMVQAAKTEIALREQIRQLKDSLQLITRQREIEKHRLRRSEE